MYIYPGEFSMFHIMSAGAFVFAVVFFLLFLALWAFISYRFACIAEQKGYSKTAYFFCAFFLLVIGCLWIAALKDKVMDRKLDRILEDLEGQKALNKVEFGEHKPV